MEKQKLILTPVKINSKTKEVLDICNVNVTYIDLDTARGDVSIMNIDRDKAKKEVWLLAIHSRIKDYINGNETFLNTFTR